MVLCPKVNYSISLLYTRAEFCFLIYYFGICGVVKKKTKIYCLFIFLERAQVKSLQPHERFYDRTKNLNKMERIPRAVGLLEWRDLGISLFRPRPASVVSTAVGRTRVEGKDYSKTLDSAVTLTARALLRRYLGKCESASSFKCFHLSACHS